MTSRLWFQRHGPVAPVVRGALTLLAASGILAMLIAGLVWGRPLTPGTFAFWVPPAWFLGHHRSRQRRQGRSPGGGPPP
jgi:hypothetical protein